MITRLRRKLSYANVTATLALFIALGGSSYALTLPRDSVGSREIRAGAVGASEVRSRAVRSSEIRDRSVALRDLSSGARRGLRGQRGANGVPGPPGPASVTYRAAISSAGERIRGNAIRGSGLGAGIYRVAFDRSVDECVSTATLAGVEGGRVTEPPAGRITVHRDRGEVLVRTFDQNGSAADLPFHLIVAC